MYRAATLAVMRAGVAFDASRTDAEGNDEAVAVAVAADLVMSTDPAEPRVLLAGEDVGAEIRGLEVTRAVSAVSALTKVREHLVAEQRRIVDETVADGAGIVVEGRDIGTVVVPDAALKIYLIASDHVRADRRTAEDTSAGRTADAASTGADLARRDRLDSSRASSPLRAARRRGRGGHVAARRRRRAGPPRGPGRRARHAHPGAGPCRWRGPERRMK